MSGPLRETTKGLHLHVRATPKASRDEVTGCVTDAAGGEVVAIKVTSVPEKGKANAAIIALIAKEARIPKSALQQVAGETDRNKVFRIASHAAAVQTWAGGLKRK